MAGSRIKFHVVVGGYNFPVFAFLGNYDNEPRAFELPMDVARSEPRGVHPVDNSGREGNYLLAYDALKQKLADLTELLHAGLRWQALLSCRRSVSLYGAIVRAADQRLGEAKRPYKTPLTGAPAARNWSRESNK